MPDDDKKTRPDLAAHAAEAGPPSWHPPPHTPPPLPTDPTLLAPTDLGRPPRSTDAVPVPRKIGRYVVRNTLGRGGMGVVYLAYDPSLDREVALKVIPAGPDADPTDLARFQAEAETAARLHHPNIVPVYEVGRTDDVAYMAMEFVTGGNLHSHLTKAPPTPTEAARLVEQLSRGVHFAHEHRVIHRDLKPSNILLTGVRSRGTGDSQPEPGESPPPSSATQPQTPKIADFGLAKRVDRPLHLTRSGVALGTPNYMAPEQARGLSSEIGPACDIHALGAILYELLVGFPPFGGGTPMETMHQVVHKIPVPPGQLRHGIPPELEQICLKCLEKHPRKRYATAAELADELQAFRDGGGPTRITRVPQPSTGHAEAVPRRRLRVLVPVVSMFLLALAAGLAVWYTARTYQRRIDDIRTERDTHARGTVEAAIALCEAGHIDEGVARLTDLESHTADLPVGEILRAWAGERLRPANAMFSANGSAVAEGSVLALTRDGSIAAVANGRQVRVLGFGGGPLGPPVVVDGEVTALGWDAAGQVLGIGTRDGRLWSVRLSRELAPVSPVGAGPGPITAVEPGSAEFRYTAGDDPTPRVVGAPPEAADAALGPLKNVALHPAGGRAVVTTTGAVRLYDPADDRWHDLSADGTATAVAYSPDGNVLAVGTGGGTVRLWDAVARTPLTPSRTVGSAVAAVGVRHVAGAMLQVVILPTLGPAVAFDWRSVLVGPPIRLANRPGKEVLGVAFGPGRETVFVTSPVGVSRWDVVTGTRLSRMAGYGTSAGPLTAGAVHGDDAVLVAGAGRVARVGHSKYEDMGSGPAPRDERAAGVTAAAGRVTTAGRKGDRLGFIRHWSDGMQGPSRCTELSSAVLSQAYVADGSALVFGCEDGTVHVWDPAAAADARPPIQTGSPVLCVAADETHVLVGCADGTVRVYVRTSGTEVVTVRHRSEVRAVAFDGTNFLTASADGSLRLWHLSGLPIGPARHHPDAISALDVRDRMAVTGGRDRYVRVWRLP